MNIIAIKKIDDCLEGTNVRDLLFDIELTRTFIDYLGDQGKLIYRDFSTKPFFTIIVRGKFTLKGSLGNKTIRMLLPEGVSPDKYIEGIKNLTENYDGNG